MTVCFCLYQPAVPSVCWPLRVPIISQPIFLYFPSARFTICLYLAPPSRLSASDERSAPVGGWAVNTSRCRLPPPPSPPRYIKANTLTLDEFVRSWNNLAENDLDELGAIVKGIVLATFLANSPIAIIPVVMVKGRFPFTISTWCLDIRDLEQRPGVPGVWCGYNNTVRLLRRSSRLIMIDIVVDSEDDFFTSRDPGCFDQPGSRWSCAVTVTPPPSCTETWLDKSLECLCLFTAILTLPINLHLSTFPKQYSECCAISVRETVLGGDLQGLFCFFWRKVGLDVTIVTCDVKSPSGVESPR